MKVIRVFTENGSFDVKRNNDSDMQDIITRVDNDPTVTSFYYIDVEESD